MTTVVNSFSSGRWGRVRFDEQMLHESSDETLSMIFSELFVTDVRRVFDTGPNVLEYKCISPKFDPVRHGDLIPEYQLWITISPDLSTSYIKLNQQL